MTWKPGQAARIDRDFYLRISNELNVHDKQRVQNLQSGLISKFVHERTGKWNHARFFFLFLCFFPEPRFVFREIHTCKAARYSIFTYFKSTLYTSTTTINQHVRCDNLFSEISSQIYPFSRNCIEKQTSTFVYRKEEKRTRGERSAFRKNGIAIPRAPARSTLFQYIRSNRRTACVAVRVGYQVTAYIRAYKANVTAGSFVRSEMRLCGLGVEMPSRCPMGNVNDTKGKSQRRYLAVSARRRCLSFVKC